jgi:hypothetical protein
MPSTCALQPGHFSAGSSILAAGDGGLYCPPCVIASIRDDIVYPPLFPPHFSRPAISLLCGLLHFNPDLRLSVRDALNHPFVTSFGRPESEVLFRDDCGSPTFDVSMQEEGSLVEDEFPGLSPGAGTAFPGVVGSTVASCAALRSVGGTGPGSAAPPGGTLPALPPPAPGVTPGLSTPAAVPASATSSSSSSTKGRAGSGGERDTGVLPPYTALVVDPNAAGSCLRTPPQRSGDPNAPCTASPVGSGMAVGSTPPGAEGSGYGSLRDHMRSLPASSPWQSPTALGVLGVGVGSSAPVVAGPSHASGLAQARASPPVAGHQVIRGPSFSLSPPAAGGVPSGSLPAVSSAGSTPVSLSSTTASVTGPRGPGAALSPCGHGDLESDLVCSELRSSDRPPRHCLPDGTLSRPSSRAQDAATGARKAPAFSINSPPLAPAGTDLDAIEPLRYGPLLLWCAAANFVPPRSPPPPSPTLPT